MTYSDDYLDDKWRKLIRLMYLHKCAKCGIVGIDGNYKLHAHHVIPRADHRHRWHPCNGVLLCEDCHAWAHAHPIRFKRWLRRNLPLIYNQYMYDGFDPRDKESIVRTLKQMIEFAKNTPEGRTRQHISDKDGELQLGFAMFLNLILLIIIIIGFLVLPKD